MSLKNLDRDMHWIEPGSGSISWPTTSGTLNSSGVVNQDVGYAYSSATTHSSATGTYVGVMIQQPTGEATPYRVKMRSNTNTFLAIGYATTQTGSDDTVSNVQLLPFNNNQVDDIFVIVESSPTSPVFFGLRTPGTSTSVTFQISVQRLNITPPRYASVVS